MAIRHGLAGRYGKSESGKRAERIIGGCLTIAAVVCFVCGLTLGYFGRRYSLWFAEAITIAGLVVFLVVWWRRLGPLIDAVSKERIKYLRGAQAEGLVAWVLEGAED